MTEGWWSIVILLIPTFTWGPSWEMLTPTCASWVTLETCTGGGRERLTFHSCTWNCFWVKLSSARENCWAWRHDRGPQWSSDDVTYPGRPQRSHLATVGLREATGVQSTAWSRSQIFHQNSETLQLSGRCEVWSSLGHSVLWRRNWNMPCFS